LEEHEAFIFTIYEAYSRKMNMELEVIFYFVL